MTAIESPATMSIELSTEMITTDTTTDSPDSINTSVLAMQPPIVILIWFEIIAASLIYGLGFIGNVLSLFIFCSSNEFRRISTGCFFLITTIANTFHLWTLTTEFLGIFNIYIYSNGFLQCRLNYFVQNVSRAMSTYLAIGIALDRLIRSELPIRSRKICTRRNAFLYTFVHFVVFSLLWSLWLSPSIIQDPITNKCINNRSQLLYFYLTAVQTPVRFVIVCIIPVMVMIAANIRMFYNMRQSRRRVANQSDLPSVVNTITLPIRQNRTSRRMTALDRMLFYMTAANVGTFVITQIPFHIYLTVRVYYGVLDPFTHSLVRAILLIWSSLYFGIAFYLYCFASPLFREKFFITSKKVINYLKGCFRREL